MNNTFKSIIVCLLFVSVFATASNAQASWEAGIRFGDNFLSMLLFPCQKPQGFIRHFMWKMISL